MPRNKHIWLKEEFITKLRGRDQHFTDEAPSSIQGLATLGNPSQPGLPRVGAGAVRGAESRGTWAILLPLPTHNLGARRAG